VAQEEYKAAQADYERETNRYERKMISEKQWRKAKRDLDLERETVKNAEILLEFDKLGATERSLKIMDLKIENAKLEQQELEWGIEIQKKIIALKKRNIKKKIEISEKQLERVEEEYAHREILATESGLISYMPRLIRSIQEGSTIDKGIGLFNIVDPTELEFKGTLRSNDVNLFRKGDPVTLVFKNGLEDLKVPAEIRSINRNPSDVAGESSQWADQNKTSGIKVYELTIVSLKPSHEILPGTYGKAILRTKEPFKGPAIPLKDLHWKDGQARLALNGIYRKVHGRAIDDLFFLEDSQLMGKVYREEGQEKELLSVIRKDGKKSRNRIELNAEMEPLSAETINVPRLRYTRVLKMNWVTEDGSYVKKGDVLFKMGSEDSTKRIEKLEKDIQRTEEEVATMEKEFENLKRERNLNKQIAENKLEIAKLELEILQHSGAPIQAYNTKTQLEQKKIQKRFALWSQQWSKDKSQVIGEVERRQLQRDLDQLVLEEERLSLQLDKFLEKDELRLSSANVNLIKEEYDYHVAMRGLQSREMNMQSRLERMQRELEYDRRQYAKIKEEEELFSIKAPKDGTIKFLKVWDGLRMSPVAPGYSVYNSMSLAMLYEINDMMVKLPLNENLYKKINKDLKVTVLVPSVTELPLQAEIMNVDSVFKPKESPDLQSESLYGAQERLGVQVFYVNIKVITPKGLVIKPGAIAKVILEWDQGQIN
jgi:multidrug resistance efflux pump